MNTEAPRAIADLVCSKCKSPILDLRSFKCHNWAYARGVLADVVDGQPRNGTPLVDAE